MPGKQILIVDDERDIRDLVSFHLKREGYIVEEAKDGEEAWHRLQKKLPDLLILDLMLPGMNGLELCRLLKGKRETAQLPIIMVTAKSEDTDKVIGLELGADDYITKPFNGRELVARVRAVFRRYRHEQDISGKVTFEDGSLFINYDAYEVRIAGRLVELGPTEMKLLFFLSRHPHRAFSRDQLLDAVWGGETFVEPRTVDVHISRLRTILEEDEDFPHRIVTVRGIGYKFLTSLKR